MREELWLTVFPLTAALAIAAEAAFGIAEMWPYAVTLPSIAAMAFVLISLPRFALQLGIALRPPLAVNVIRALGPVYVFVVQQFDYRFIFSGRPLCASFCFRY